MGSGAQTVIETVDHLTGQAEKVGVLVVRLYRPFSVSHFIDALPKTTKAIAVLDRTKEAGAVAEPLYLDVSASLRGNHDSDSTGFPRCPYYRRAIRPVEQGVYSGAGKSRLRRTEEGAAESAFHHWH